MMWEKIKSELVLSKHHGLIQQTYKFESYGADDLVQYGYNTKMNHNGIHYGIVIHKSGKLDVYENQPMILSRERNIVHIPECDLEKYLDYKNYGLYNAVITLQKQLNKLWEVNNEIS